MHQTIIMSRFIKILLTGFASLFLSTIVSADLPEVVEQGLNKAGLDNKNISLIIQPINTPQTSKLNPYYLQLQQDLLEQANTQSSISSVDTDFILNEANESLYLSPQVLTQLPLSDSIEHLSNVARTPASTMKLIPTFIALDQLGSDFRWVTQVYYTGVKIGGTLHGDLIIKGSGEPKMTHERLTMLLYQVQKAGILHIDGNIIWDGSIFQKVGKDPSQFDNKPLRPYNASPDGFLVNFSSVGMTSLPSKNGTMRLTYKPSLAGYRLPNLIDTRSGRCRTAKQSLAPVWQASGLQFNKNLPSACGLHTFYIAYPDPKVFAQKVVQDIWQTLGNTLTGEVLSIEDTSILEQLNQDKVGLLSFGVKLPIVNYPSQPLAQQIYDINHYSNNVMTEQVLLSLPVYDDKKSINHSNYSVAIKYVDDWWQTHLSSQPPYLTNGSGLCRDCKVTANNLAELLAYAYQHPEFETYLQSLGVAGISGTIYAHKNRLPNSLAIGRAWIKTGTLDNVTAMAGYVHGSSGQDYVVVGIINADSEQKLNTTQARRTLDVMLNWTARH